jgi:hypothetical protein
LYQKEHGLPALTTPSDVYYNSIQPQAASMQLSGLGYWVVWNDGTQRRARSEIVNDVVVTRANTVTVTVTYTWDTGLFGSLPVSSSSTMPISY